MTAAKPGAKVFRVPKAMDFFGGLMHRRRGFFVRMGNWETSIVRDAIDGVRIERPVYVAGLARSGSTIQLEILSKIPGVVTHRYRDYPPIYTPYLWSWFLDRMPRGKAVAVERTHLDGIMVTPESPEALDEVLWMAFFADIHQPDRRNVLDADTSNAAFEEFYRDHIRKLIAARRGSRYVSKGNYNVARMEYLLKLFPDARFIVPVREPSAHIASLMKQHQLFREGEANNPRMLEHMRRVGHFEFGMDRRPINFGDRARTDEILDLWEKGKEIRGWARSWAAVYDHIADRIDRNEALRDATLVVNYEEFCKEPENTIRAMLNHCGLPMDEAVIAEYQDRIRLPSYYKQNFSDNELAEIAEETAATAARFGYSGHPCVGPREPEPIEKCE